MKRILKKEEKDFSLVYDKETKELSLNSSQEITLRLSNNFHLVVDGNWDTSVNGEYNLITNGQDINIDSVKADIHLNSRRAKQIRGLQEAIEYRKKTSKRKSLKTCKRKSDEADDFFKEVVELFDRVHLLEQEIKDLKKED